MKLPEARKLLGNQEENYALYENFLDGIKIICKYDTTCHISVLTDIIYCGVFSENMPEDELLLMNQLGFHLEEEGIWGYFI